VARRMRCLSRFVTMIGWPPRTNRKSRQKPVRAAKSV
jgi:hypothetical protein